MYKAKKLMATPLPTAVSNWSKGKVNEVRMADALANAENTEEVMNLMNHGVTGSRVLTV